MIRIMNRISALHPALDKFIRFAMVGVVGTAAHYSVMATLIEVWGVSITVATTCGFLVGSLVNYVLNRRFTFDSDSSHAAAFPRFLAVGSVGAVINWIVVTQLLHHFAIHYLVAQAIATCTVLIWNFGVNYLWTFRT